MAFGMLMGFDDTLCQMLSLIPRCGGFLSQNLQLFMISNTDQRFQLSQNDRQLSSSYSTTNLLFGLRQEKACFFRHS